ncbi:MAG: hypothetical protein HC886_07370 [Leptolyngbyaceae cyanobacterium SM1_1_3]|nr:hypothetical protein [Leptolyngbyaceae cyanobacterium SM1_1_3]
MGRNAKLRKQRRQERQGEPALSAAEYPLFRQPRKKTQLEVATLPQPEPSESKPKSLLGRLFSRSQSDSKSSLTASADEMERFFITYQQWLGRSPGKVIKPLAPGCF